MSNYTGPVGPTKNRSIPMMIGGIILTVIGGLGLLGQAASLSSGRMAGATNAGELVGTLLGAAIFIVVPLVVGILLISKSKRRV